MGKDVIIALDFDSREKTLAFLDAVGQQGLFCFQVDPHGQQGVDKAHPVGPRLLAGPGHGGDVRHIGAELHIDRGMLNAVGLQNPGVEKVIAEELPRMRGFSSQARATAAMSVTLGLSFI